MRSALRTSSSATRSISSTPLGSMRGRVCPEPICSAEAAKYTSGAAKRLACHDAIAAPATTATAPTIRTRATARAASQKTSDREIDSSTMMSDSVDGAAAERGLRLRRLR